MAAQAKPFDDNSDFDQLADRLRRDVTATVLQMQDNAVYMALSLEDQIYVVMAGLSTALVGTCFSMVHDNSRNQMMAAITEYLPQAREQVEGT